MWRFSNKRNASSKSSSLRNPDSRNIPSWPSPATILAIQSDDYDWASIFSDARLRDGRQIDVVQTGWQDIIVHSDTYSNDVRPIVEVRNLSRCGSDLAEKKVKVVRPDFVLIRNEVYTPSFDGRSLLSGLMFANVPSVNSLQSISLSCDRAAMMGFLHGLHRRLGDAFPVVPQHFACGSRALMYGYTFPAVVKVGSAHAGAGKMRVMDHHQMSDFRSVCAMTDQYCFVEPFIEGEYDLRIQKIGSNYRAFRRRDVSGEWKTNTGTAVLDEVTLEPRWKRWADEAAVMFGGLDILTVDAIVEIGTAREYILEVNGASSGLHPDCADEDNEFIRDLVIDKMNEIVCSEGSVVT